MSEGSGGGGGPVEAQPAVVAPALLTVSQEPEGTLVRLSAQRPLRYGKLTPVFEDLSECRSLRSLRVQEI